MNEHRCLTRSMRPNEIANWIMFGNRQRKRPAVIAEGKSDMHVYAFVVVQDCRLFYAQGKNTVISVIEIIRRAKYPGVVAIIDADFTRLRKTPLPDYQDIICTDTHDIETLVIRQSGFRRFLLQHNMQPQSLVEFDGTGLQERTCELQQNLLDVASVIGYIRLFSLRADLRFDFKLLDHNKIVGISQGKLELQYDELEGEVLQKCNTSCRPVRWGVILKELAQLKSENHDLWQVCCGHDMTGMLCVYLNSIGINRTRSQIERELALTFDTLEFTSTACMPRYQDGRICIPTIVCCADRILKHSFPKRQSDQTSFITSAQRGSACFHY